MAHLIDKDALLAWAKETYLCENASMVRKVCYKQLLEHLDTLEAKEVDVSSISENMAEAYEYLDFTHTSNLAHNKPMVAARLRKAIKELHSVGLFKLTHDEKYRMENLGLKEKKGE